MFLSILHKKIFPIFLALLVGVFSIFPPQSITQIAEAGYCTAGNCAASIQLPEGLIGQQKNDFGKFRSVGGTPEKWVTYSTSENRGPGYTQEKHGRLCVRGVCLHELLPTIPPTRVERTEDSSGNYHYKLTQNVKGAYQNFGWGTYYSDAETPYFAYDPCYLGGQADNGKSIGTYWDARGDKRGDFKIWNNDHFINFSLQKRVITPGGMIMSSGKGCAFKILTADWRVIELQQIIETPSPQKLTFSLGNISSQIVDGAIKISFHTEGVTKIRIECATSWGRYCKPYEEGGDGLVRDWNFTFPKEIDKNDTVVTVRAYNSYSNQSDSKTISVEGPSVDPVTLLVEGWELGTSVMNKSLVEVFLGDGKCGNTVGIKDVCNMLTGNNLISLAGGLMGIFFPGLGQAVDFAIKIVRPIVVGIVGMLVNIINQVFIQGKKIAGLGKGPDVLARFFKTAIPTFLAETAGSAFTTILGECLGRPFAGLVSGGVQALINGLGQGLKLIPAQLPFIGGLHDVGNFLAEPCNGTGCSAGIDAGKALGSQAGSSIVKSVCGATCSVLDPIKPVLEGALNVVGASCSSKPESKPPPPVPKPDIIGEGFAAVGATLNETHNRMASNMIQRLCFNATGSAINKEQAMTVGIGSSNPKTEAGGLRVGAQSGLFHCLWTAYDGLQGNTKDLNNNATFYSNVGGSEAQKCNIGEMLGEIKQFCPVK